MTEPLTPAEFLRLKSPYWKWWRPGRGFGSLMRAGTTLEDRLVLDNTSTSPDIANEDAEHDAARGPRDRLSQQGNIGDSRCEMHGSRIESRPRVSRSSRVVIASSRARHSPRRGPWVDLAADHGDPAEGPMFPSRHLRSRRQLFIVRTTCGAIMTLNTARVRETLEHADRFYAAYHAAETFGGPSLYFQAPRRSPTTSTRSGGR